MRDGIFTFLYKLQNGNAAQGSFTRWLLVVFFGGRKKNT
jgi:hypothetical protein